MQIVKATEHDTFAIATLMKGFEQASSHVRVDVKYTSDRYKGILKSGEGAIFMLKDDCGTMIGALGCIKANDLHNGDLIAIETFWYVKPDCRGGGMRLLRAFDEWAKEQGCVKKALIHMIDSHPEELNKIYRHKGYVPIEIHHVAEVK